MDWSAIFAALGVVSTLGMAVVGYFVSGQRRELDAAKTAADKLRDEFVTFQVKVAENYVTTHDLSEIKDALVRIEGWIRSKS
jgi:Tfp pilus assembly protein PilO